MLQSITLITSSSHRRNRFTLPIIARRGGAGKRSLATGNQVKYQMLFGRPGAMELSPVLKELKKKKPKTPKTKAKIDPVFISKSRELWDKYLEQVNEHGYRLESVGKYELCRDISESTSPKEIKCLAA